MRVIAAVYAKRTAAVDPIGVTTHVTHRAATAVEFFMNLVSFSYLRT